ncbi:MAG: hypothetical protein K9I99_15070 [Melioribacteraceae bacterium]|nr:hypothetical protein [Melioribacteraceae bacterium]MCF8414546.1 hypothetical protein [Melioribacteraceae bacterium]
MSGLVPGRIFRCKYTGSRIKLMLAGTFGNGCLPAEFVDGKEPPGEEWDSSIHKSHLLKCPQHQKEWPQIQKKFKKAQNDKFLS